ncbi:hypothetical protein DFH07DRAFT_764684 [Mycena maculata]|uniref:Uncharacterized protein n=1 Tax=Mycena maculata TaxID=230809 RepID=A0AAD7KC42_9AGAR|nr:hypothetical protein DFH07DRAFT_764684 [Mycena maculata]
MCWLGLAWKPWLGPGFIWLGLHKSQARAQARKSGLAWPGPGLGHGFNRDRRRQRSIIFIGWHSDYFLASHTHLRDKKMKLWLAWPGLAWEISGQKPKPAQARGVAWPGLTNPGLAWPGFWLEARPSTSLTV